MNASTDRPPEITADLVARLIRGQFPQWAKLSVTAVDPGGHDNRSFRLGQGMLVRLPSAAEYAAAVEREQRWLPVLSPALSQPIPLPIALGLPGCGFPWKWSVYRWLDGTAARPERNFQSRTVCARPGGLSSFATGRVAGWRSIARTRYVSSWRRAGCLRWAVAAGRRDSCCPAGPSIPHCHRQAMDSRSGKQAARAARLGAWRHCRRQPPGRRRTPLRRHRLRPVLCRGSRLRPGHCVDAVRRQDTADLPLGHRTRRRTLGSRAGLGSLEGTDRGRRAD